MHRLSSVLVELSPVFSRVDCCLAGVCRGPSGPLHLPSRSTVLLPPCRGGAPGLPLPVRVSGSVPEPGEDGGVCPTDRQAQSWRRLTSGRAAAPSELCVCALPVRGLVSRPPLAAVNDPSCRLCALVARLVC